MESNQNDIFPYNDLPGKIKISVNYVINNIHINIWILIVVDY